MILAALVWAYWICLLLSGDGVAMPVKEKGRISPVSSNLEDYDDLTLDEPVDWEELQLDYDLQQPLWGASSQNQPLNSPGPDADVVEQHHGVSPPYHSLEYKPSSPQSGDRHQPSAYQPASSGFTNSNEDRQAGDTKRVSFERIFQFPHGGFQQNNYPSAHRGQLPAYPASMGWPVGFQTDNRRVPAWQEMQLVRRSHDSPPSSYISQYRGHYTQGRSKFSRDSYSPNADLPLIW
ncbi:uncharacterized protein LOC133642246 [Entelurus aequoreus]|uniref:uncharacterized protein LOC133642246 n=1 Tax=Entelurus aequoreus TaxID=161455 RepID=UPI002B1E203E|nr:uncharacterized protein LOC133642246 [Entelurus aequoreus]